MEGGGLFNYHINDISVYLGRQTGGEASPIERTSLRLFLVVSFLGAGVLNVCSAKNILLLVQNEEHMCEMYSFNLPR